MPTYILRCPECRATFEATRSDAVTCGTRCRRARGRQRERERDAAKLAAFEALLAHGDVIRAAASEGRAPDAEMLRDLAVRMDALADIAVGKN